MKNKRLPKILVIILLLGMIFQGGLATAELATDESQSTTDNSTDEENMEITEEVKNKIKESDPENFEKNIANFENLLSTLNVHWVFKKEIERLVLEDYKIQDLLIAYEFLYHSFGVSGDLEIFVTKKEMGKSWEIIFEVYNQEKAKFIPRSFDSNYLEKLMEMQGLSSDDIMIADRVSVESGQPFKEVIMRRMEAQTWKEVNAQVDILYSAGNLPRVPVTSDQLEKYTQSEELTEQHVIEAFVLAHKVNESAEIIINKIKAGYTEEAIYSESYVKKYY